MKISSRCLHSYYHLLDNGVVCSFAACSCNSTGTENGTTCGQLGGHCHCKPGVTGHSCDRCLPGYFNFTDSGCTGIKCTINWNWNILNRTLNENKGSSTAVVNVQ